MVRLKIVYDSTYVPKHTNYEGIRFIPIKDEHFIRKDNLLVPEKNGHGLDKNNSGRSNFDRVNLTIHNIIIGKCSLFHNNNYNSVNFFSMYWYQWADVSPK